jgi:hypothetical protein
MHSRGLAKACPNDVAAVNGDAARHRELLTALDTVKWQVGTFVASTLFGFAFCRMFCSLHLLHAVLNLGNDYSMDSHVKNSVSYLPCLMQSSFGSVLCSVFGKV